MTTLEPRPTGHSSSDEASDRKSDLEASSSGTAGKAIVPPEQQAIGVSRIEALYAVFGGTGPSIWLLYASIAAIAYAYGLSSNTVSNFLAFATSAYGEHSLLSTIDVAVYVIGGVGKPFVAKLADITSRPTAYLISLIFYIIGFIVVAASSSVGAVAGGHLMYEIGNVGLDLVTDLLVADLTPLHWRGFVSSLTSAPYIVNAYISGFIVDGLGENGWRWGYGMFAVVMPAVMAPALMVLFWADMKAKRMGVLSLSASSYDGRVAATERRSWLAMAQYFMVQIDAFGLLLLAAGWSLLFLPFTLKSSAAGGYSNPSLVAMFVVGPLLLIAFVFWEKWGTAHPIMPMRILNRTFICCVIIDAFYFISGALRNTYYSSWTYVVTDWTLYEWTIFSNTLTVGLCVFGLLAGLIMRYTHRYKWLQFSGLCIRIVGMGLTFYARGPHATNVALAWTQILIAMGGAFSVVGSRVGTQASVPHEDLAAVIANLALWTKLGGAIGAAAAGSVWAGQMPKNLTKYLAPSGLSAVEIQKLYGSIKLAKSATAEVREGVLNAYNDTVEPLYIAALVLSIVPLVAAALTANFYLGKTLNAVDGKVHPIYAAPRPQEQGRAGEQPAGSPNETREVGKGDREA